MKVGAALGAEEAALEPPFGRVDSIIAVGDCVGTGRRLVEFSVGVTGASVV